MLRNLTNTNATTTKATDNLMEIYNTYARMFNNFGEMMPNIEHDVAFAKVMEEMSILGLRIMQAIVDDDPNCLTADERAEFDIYVEEGNHAYAEYQKALAM